MAFQRLKGSSSGSESLSEEEDDEEDEEEEDTLNLLTEFLLGNLAKAECTELSSDFCPGEYSESS